MIDLATIQKMWDIDAVLDPINIDNTTVDTSVLHAKYMKLYNMGRMTLKKREQRQTVLKKEKWLYYTGKMSKGEMDAKGWAYDPFDGHTKPLKSELNYYINADEDVQKIMGRVAYAEERVEVLKEIMDTMRWRGNHIKNIIEFRKFVSGN
jgi:hypothetical protein